ncbi:exo-alpha-sialidase [Pseudarthrobacter phenanthrenivorans]|uniref:Exo-alpha-sialidase n=1 Tax=Pseudarthrobacter phenanthrenivorans TaxID=361575 RepID=A0A3B0G622_PSEPS|nr:sialidase family protein [Pseudarthrobacter phenanthrenivorans]RKO27655.1 exo-alpha-sialidase [Pseudarthrobacter phenanthrenivorans]
MGFTFAAMTAWDSIGKQAVKNTSFQVYAMADTGFVTPLAITDPFDTPLAGNILNSGTQAVFPEFKQADHPTVRITDSARNYIWTVTSVVADDSVSEFIGTSGSASAAAVKAAAKSAVSTDLDNPASEIATKLSATIDAQIDASPTVAAKLGKALAPVAALSLPGSKQTGNLRGGTTVATASGALHNAFPGLTLCDDGTLLAVWRSAGQHDPGPSKGVIKARRYGTDLQPVGAEYTVLTDALDLRDPMLTKLEDGRILMQYFKHDGTANTVAGVFVAVSADNGATFTQLSKVPFTWDTLVASSGRVVVAPNGDWLVAAYGRTSATFQQIRLMRSTNGGTSWTGEVTVAEGQAESRNYMEPVIGTLPDGQTLICLIRVADSTGANPAIYRTTSTDNGATWAAETSVVAGDGGRPAWIRLKSGGLLLITRNQAAAPYPVRFRTSWDNGLTWTTPTQLGGTPANQGTYAQPVELAPGLIGVAYAIEAGPAASTVSLAYLADGYGYSPAGDDFADPEGTLFKGAGEGGIAGGAAALGNVLGWPVWTLGASSADQCAFAFRIPASWKKFDITLLWVNTAGGTTADVVFRHDYEQVNAAASLTSGAGATATVTTGNQFILTETPMAAGVSRTGEFLRVKPTRLGADAADTYANSIGIIGVRVRRVE